MKRILMLGVFAALAVPGAWASVVAEIKVDRPLRDPSICRAKDETY